MNQEQRVLIVSALAGASLICTIAGALGEFFPFRPAVAWLCGAGVLSVAGAYVNAGRVRGERKPRLRDRRYGRDLVGLRSGQTRQRLRSVKSIERRGPVMPSAVPALTDVLWDDNWRVRLHAIRALEAYGALATPAAPAIVKLLQDEHSETRCAAARTLCQLGPAAVCAAEELEEMTHDADPIASAWANEALVALQAEAPHLDPDQTLSLTDREWSRFRRQMDSGQTSFVTAASRIDEPLLVVADDEI